MLQVEWHDATSSDFSTKETGHIGRRFASFDLFLPLDIGLPMLNPSVPMMSFIAQTESLASLVGELKLKKSDVGR